MCLTCTNIILDRFYISLVLKMHTYLFLLLFDNEPCTDNAHIFMLGLSFLFKNESCAEHATMFILALSLETPEYCVEHAKISMFYKTKWVRRWSYAEMHKPSFLEEWVMCLKWTDLHVWLLRSIVMCWTCINLHILLHVLTQMNHVLNMLKYSLCLLFIFFNFF